MNVHIRRLREGEGEAVVRLSLAAWAPVFHSFEQVLGTEIFTRQYPDWQTGQRGVVEGTCAEQGTTTVWVAEVGGTIAGFIAIELNDEDRIGEVQLLAVDPAFQNHGVGTALNEFAVRTMKQAGMRLAVAGTGGDPGHALARRSYEKAGYTPLPLVRYYKDL